MLHGAASSRLAFLDFISGRSLLFAEEFDSMAFTHSRRTFLGCVGLSLGGIVCGARADERPRPVHPRATDGDERFEPDWDERLTIRVGQHEGDLLGRDDRVLQAAVDYVARMGGGTVQVLPGTYTLRNSIYLPSKIRLLGTGADSIITKIPSEKVELADDSDWYDQEITLAAAKSFRVGDGVTLRATNPHHGGAIVIKRTFVARSGNRFKLNDGLRDNLWLTGKPTCTSIFPLLTSEYTADVVIENITLDGNRANNEHLDGNYGGCIFLQDCNRYTIRNVTARNNHGDGISFQICHDVLVENCLVHDNSDLGVHPGSGSQRPWIRNNRLERNDQGIFWCWGVKYGLAEGNWIEENRSFGMSIGHCDTDNLIRNNDIRLSGKIGVLFRDDTRGKDFWANRNRLEGNRIVDSGAADGVGIEITGKTRDLVIDKNEIRETRSPEKRTGIRILPEVGAVKLGENQIVGYPTPILDQRDGMKR
jgi:parallel beta-helix repeat protein